ncbi:MAG: glycoside hydrolase family 125 protein [Acidimicrobiales bacterium]
MSVSGPVELTTYAPEIDEPSRFIPTGNLWVSLSEIDLADGAVHTVGALIERVLGLVEATGGPGHSPLIRPVLILDGATVEPGPLEWERVGHWLPHFTSPCPSGVLEGWFCAPVDERGFVLRLAYRSHGPRTATVELGWTGQWGTTTVTHLRSKPIGAEPVGHDDPWTGSRTVSASAGSPLLSVSWQGGEGVVIADQGAVPRWLASATGEVGTGQSLAAELFVGVATEPDGAATTALHLRRRGFDQLWDTTTGWLADHALTITDARPGLAERINVNLFFNYFFAQGDCLDTGRPVMVTSRSHHYYVSAAFWSRDAYCWTFPALLLTDSVRARSVLVSTIAAGGPRLADHALYLNGTSLYPGFELDQAAAPIIAVRRYVQMTGDSAVLTEPEVRAVLDGLVRTIEPWRHPRWDLYGTFLLPTDDPTDFPYTTTGNALVAAAFEALAALDDLVTVDRSMEAPSARLSPDDRRQTPADRASAIRAAMAERLTVEVPGGRMWAWACDESGRTECRDEPPLGLRTLPFWGVGANDDPVQRATSSWLSEDNPHHYQGTFGGSGSAHFPHPSGFDLASRLLEHDLVDGEPLDQLAAVPMDQGLACESWDVDTGRVRTGAAMASMAGLLAWTAWEHLSGPARWDRPRPR